MKPKQDIESKFNDMITNTIDLMAQFEYQQKYLELLLSDKFYLYGCDDKAIIELVSTLYEQMFGLLENWMRNISKHLNSVDEGITKCEQRVWDIYDLIQDLSNQASTTLGLLAKLAVLKLPISLYISNRLYLLRRNAEQAEKQAKNGKEVAK